MGNPGVESDPSFWEKRGLRLWGWINSAHEISGTLVFGRRSELCSLISCCNEADASVDGSQVPAASSLRRAEVTGPAAPNTFPRPVCSSTNNRGATECSPNWKVLQVCECWRPCWSVGTRGFGSRLPGEPSKLATRFVHPEINGPSPQLPA